MFYLVWTVERHSSLDPRQRSVMYRVTEFIGKWSMVEVFIIGVIVSLVKIAAMATVVVGASFWAYAAFAICFTAAVANLDRYQCWERIEALGAK